MPRRIVVFDTNVYRGTPPARFAGTCTRGRDASVVAMASPWVVLELLQHLADPEDPDFGFCWCALSRLREHTRMWDGSRACIPFIGDASEALAYEWYGSRDRSAKELCGQIEPIIANAIDEGDPHACELAECAVHVREFVSTAKGSYGLGLKRGMELLKTLAADANEPMADRERRRLARGHYATDGPDYAAETIALGIARRAGREVNCDQLAKQVSRTLEVARVAVTFLDRELRQLADDQLDPTKPENLNSLWDLQLCFLVSSAVRVDERALLNDAPLLLVTNERRIRNAATEAGHGDLVLTLNGFEAWLSTIC